MSTVTAFIVRRPVASYFALTFAISWGGILLVIAASGGIPADKDQFERAMPLAVPALLGGPTIAGLLLTGLTGGRAGLRELLSRLLRWRVGVRWYAEALLTAPIVTLGLLLGLSQFLPQFLPGGLATDDVGARLPFGIAVALSAGIFEELGWTGFAIPRLRQNRSIVRTGLIVGVLWGAWHIMANVVFAAGAYGGTLPLPVFLTARAVGDVVGLLPAYRILMVRVYDRTGSLLVAVLMHVSLTASTIIFEPLGLSGIDLVVYDIVGAAAWWAIVAAVVRRPRGEPAPGGIAEITPLRLGGLDQWVMIRGEQVTNPLLILLHGGPGFPETSLFRHFNTPLETRFTVVYWEQRGSGRSFNRVIPRASMNVEQFITDLNELVDAVRARLGHEKVTIFGHSWGSALGVLYAARFPEKVAAYVGSGQIGDWAAGESLSYAFALGEAERLNRRKALKALRAIGPPPHTASSLWTERTWLQRLEGRFSVRSLWTMARIFIGGPESSVFDLPRTLRGFRFSLDTMWAEVSALNLPNQVPSLQVPVFLFLGRRDHWVPPDTSVAWFNALAAPLKMLVWFEDSGHEPFADEADKFNASMAELVRPVSR